MRPTYALLALLVAGSAVALSGCEAAEPEADTALLTLDLEPVVGAEALQTGRTYTVNGYPAQLTYARMYLSNFVLLASDGSEVLLTADPITVRARAEDGTDVTHTVSERIVLAESDQGATVTDLDEVPAGGYTGVRFTLGITGIDNRVAAEDAPAGHPLAPQDPSMHWDWNEGYIYLRIDGLLDVDGDGQVDPADVDGDGQEDPRDPASGMWRLHMGSEPYARTVELDAPFTLAAGDQRALHLQVDFARFAEGVDYDDPFNRFCMTDDCQAIVEQARDNAAAAFTFVGLE